MLLFSVNKKENRKMNADNKSIEKANYKEVDCCHTCVCYDGSDPDGFLWCGKHNTQDIEPNGYCDDYI